MINSSIENKLREALLDASEEALSDLCRELVRAGYYSTDIKQDSLLFGVIFNEDGEEWRTNGWTRKGNGKRYKAGTAFNVAKQYALNHWRGKKVFVRMFIAEEIHLMEKCEIGDADQEAQFKEILKEAQKQRKSLRKTKA